MSDTLKATGLKTRKEVVEPDLKTLIKLKKQERIKRFKEKLEWSGDLDDMMRKMIVILNFVIRNQTRWNENIT